jgi:hypothetical protein
MDQDSEHPGVTGDMHSPNHCIAQQGSPEALIVVANIDGKASEQQDGQWVRHVAPHCLGRSFVGDGSSRKAVVTDYDCPDTQHEATGSAARLIFECALFQPLI